MFRPQMQTARPFVKNQPPKRTSLRRWQLRLLALLLGCLPFLVAELALRASGLPPERPAVDPLVDLHHLEPLFQLSADGTTYSIPPERLNLFREARFAARKPAGTFRIFALGASTTQGEPYSTPTAFPAWLKIDLETATGGRAIEVINCGGLSYASYRVKAILAEVLGYAPDLIVIYTGQNEFLEERSYSGWRDVPLPLARAGSWLQHVRLVQFVRWAVQGSADRDQRRLSNPTELKREVDALLDYSGGLEAYHRDDPWREPVVAHFRWNLVQMVEDCQRAGVPVILMRPVVNLLDCPPMKAELRTDLTVEQKKRFEAAWQAARENAEQPERALHELKIAYAIDPGHAGVNFFLGRLAWESGDWPAAQRYLQAAKDLDVCPLRALTSIQDAVTEVARQTRAPLVDADQIFIDRSPHGIVGNNWLVDHVHPTIEGHQLLGEALCEVCLREGFLVERDPQWRQSRTERVRAHLRSLGEDYFHRGKQRLEGLLLWTQGRAKKLRP
jgi:hypothetical protein